MDDRVTMATFEMNAPPAVSDEYVTRTGLIFRCGDYPSHTFALTEDEADAAIAAFRPVPLNLEHKATVLDGKLGRLERVWRQGADIYGETRLARWLDEALDTTARKVSTEWDRSAKALTGLGLVLDPQVSDAVLMSAYATFAAARHDTPPGQVALQMIHDHAAASGAVCAKPGGKAKMSSKHEAATIQTIHDMTTQHGAQCQAIGQDMAAHVPGMGLFSRTKGSPMKLFDWLTAQAKEQGVEIEDSPAVFNAPAPDPRIAELEQSLKAQQETMARFKTERIESEAAAEADRLILASKALPAEREAIVAAFRQAATDDASHGAVTFSAADGQSATTSRVAQLRALYEARPGHGLTAEQVQAARFGVPNVTQTGADDAEKAKAEAERLLAMTDLGRAALKHKE